MSSWAPSLEAVKTPKQDKPTETGSWGPSPIHLIKNPGLQLNPNGPQVRDSDLPQESMGKLTGNYASETLPVLGGVLGSLVGPEGTAGGAGLGAVLRDLAQSKINDTPKPSVPAQIGTFGKNALLTGAGGKIAGAAAEAFPGSIESKLAAAIANGVFGQGVKATEAAVSGGQAETGPTALSKDVLANLGFDIVGGALVKRGVAMTPAGKASKPETITLREAMGQLRERVAIGEGPLPVKTRPSASTAEQGLNARTSIQKKLKAVTELEKKQRKFFEENHRNSNILELPQKSEEIPTGVLDAQGNPITHTETTTTKVQGPIPTINATMLAADFAPGISKFMRGAEFEALTPGQQSQLKELDAHITKLISGTPTIDAQGNTTYVPVLDYETAKQMKSIISRTVGGQQFKTLAQGGLTKLAVALDKDIDAGVSNWRNGKEAKRLLDEMNATSKFKTTVYSKEIQDRIHGKDAVTGQIDSRNLEGDPSQMFDEAMSSPEAYNRFKESLGPENEHIAKLHYFDNVLTPKGFGTNFNKFKPREIINELEDPNSLSRTAMTANERNGIIRIMRTAEASGTIKDRALNFQGRMVGLGAGVLGRVAGGGVGPGAAATGVLARIGTEEFFHAMIAKPESMEYANRLLKIPSGSTEAQLLTKKLMKALRGSTVTVDVNGKDTEGEILESGKIKYK